MLRCFRPLKREVKFLSCHIPILVASAFLASVGGVLLWVNGGSAWYFYRLPSGGVPQMSVVFSIWVVAYGLCGIGIALLGLLTREGCRKKTGTLSLACVLAGSYLLMLLWYVVFFCTRLTVFSAILLLISMAQNGFLLWKTRRLLLTLPILMAVLTAVEGYFVFFSFSAL